MVIKFSKTLGEALQEIGYGGELKNTIEYILHNEEKKIQDMSKDYKSKLVQRFYREVLGKNLIPELVNENYGHLLKEPLVMPPHSHDCNNPFTFLWERYNDSILYGEYGMPSRFNMWLGQESFILGLEQKGKGFNVIKINKRKPRKRGGTGFKDLRETRHDIFFDNPEDARAVYLQYKF